MTAAVVVMVVVSDVVWEVVQSSTLRRSKKKPRNVAGQACVRALVFPPSARTAECGNLRSTSTLRTV
ncbi:hypothetical protein Tdes44962_MAKER05460 [Teratosphaeria destructans]|uniref:Secreted protein n=1 Tax=Teratosphaeria destructans TaxID=418781 RepID=A0A9W7SJQ7_9PEZI|nr:hypothetical protein Tdes44962_MAKER05460 [Teratosphaeria destructans]